MQLFLKLHPYAQIAVLKYYEFHQMEFYYCSATGMLIIVFFNDNSSLGHSYFKKQTNKQTKNGETNMYKNIPLT